MNGAHPFPRTWWITPGRLLGGCYPGATDPTETPPRLLALLDHGVRSVICLQEEDELGGGGRPFPAYADLLRELAAARGLELAWARLPVRDQTPPPPAVVREALTRVRAEPGVTYVHCWGGHGRTGVVAGCWLREQGLSADQALRQVRAARAHDPYLRDQPAPQTPAQVAAIRSWNG